MPGRYTDEQRAGIMANRRARGAGLKYGYSLTDQGYKDAPEQGGSAFALDRLHSQYGWGADPTWQIRMGPNGQVQYKARGENPDRVRVTGGDWFDAPDHVQRGYQNINNFKNEFGQDKTFQDFKMYQGGQQQFNKQGWQQDPTGQFMYNPANPSDRRDMMGRRIADDGSAMGMGPGTTGGAFNFGAPPTGQQVSAPQNAGIPAPAPPPAAPAAPTGPGVPKIGDLNANGIAAGEVSPGTGMPDYGNPYKKRKNLGNLAFGTDFGS